MKYISMQEETAIDWLLNNLPERYKNAMLTTCQEEIKQAKEKEKESMYYSFLKGGEVESVISYDDFIEEYYEPIYKQYGLDEETRRLLNKYEGGNPNIKEF